jgi:hypothetical protein
MTDQSASQTAQNVSWPGGKPIAVLVSILFETWSDGKAPSYFPRTTPLRPGTVDRGAIQWAQYGGNEGLWRILRTLDRHAVPATIFCSGRCGELYPQAIAAAVKAGHDIAGHGYTQDGLFCYMTREESARRSARPSMCWSAPPASAPRAGQLRPTAGPSTPSISCARKA